MKIIQTRNAHSALPEAIKLLKNFGVQRNSRNGPVIQIQEPVSIEYQKPCERVIFWPERDANPTFHLLESLWMISGRNDIAPLVRYAKQIAEYSDDGKILHGAYGHRWRNHFGLDQLQVIIESLKKNPEDRRCVLQMWDAPSDLGRQGKDVPCNTIATFSRGIEGQLDLTVFQRSGDVIWGVLGANVVHFSMLQEYVALAIGCSVGSYHQVTTNFHAYLNTLEGVKNLQAEESNPYDKVHLAPIFHGTHEELDEAIKTLLMHEETRFHLPYYPIDEPFFDAAYLMLRAHLAWRENPAPVRFTESRKILALGDQHNDWIKAGTDWMLRRQAVWEKKQ